MKKQQKAVSGDDRRTDQIVVASLSASRSSQVARNPALSSGSDTETKNTVMLLCTVCIPYRITDL